jgi:toxin YoeB
MGTKFRPEFKKGFQKELDWFLDHNRFMAAKVKVLIADTLAHPTHGLGHPEHLRHLGENVWSRHIDKKDRLVYQIIGDVILFIQCRGHYKDH